jgi:hypothetical protein
MAGNIQPIFTRVGDIQGGVLVTSAMGSATGYNGQDANTTQIFAADSTNGGYIQRLRFKPTGTNVATVARVFINEGVGNFASAVSAVSGTPTGTPSASGGTLSSGSYFAKIQAVDQQGVGTAMSTESASVSVTGPTGSIVWNWTASTGAASYRIFVGQVTNQQTMYFTSTSNTTTQTTATLTPTNAGPPYQGMPADFLTTNMFIGELSLPATTNSTSAALVDIEYPMNMALPPGYKVTVGLGTAVASGWVVTGIGGKY